MENIGKIVSLSLVILTIIFISVFFGKKKAIGALCLYNVSVLLLAGTYFAEWYGVKNLGLAQNITFLICTLAIIIFSIVYANDIRSGFFSLSKLHRKTEGEKVTDEEIRLSIKAIVDACQTLSKSRTGALIVIVHDKIDNYILDSGIRMNALISAPLLESIFNTKCPMHDGAVIIKNNRILTAGSFLPLSQSRDVEKNLGTRHRAGIGVTESEGSDVTSIIISEETGIISTAKKGVLRRYLTPERLYDMLYEPYSTKRIETKYAKKRK